MNNFWKRLITGVVFLVVLISGIMINQWTFAVIFAAIDVLALGEFYNACRQKGYQPLAVYSTAVALISFAISFMSAANIIGRQSLLLIVPMLVPIYIVILFSHRSNPVASIATTLYGLVYIGLPFALVSPIAFHTGSYQSILVLGMFVIIWINDTCAYCVGKLIGRHHMFERISPKKTWEGLIGGASIAIAGSYVLAHLSNVLTPQQWAVSAAIIVVFGTLGDLTESQFKRTIGIKDSSNLLPGHGGFLDRFDSIILAIPVIFTYLQLFT